MKLTRKTKAFTLLELVVVIGVVATVAAILIPLVAQVRRSAGDIGCQNNLRQLLQALEMFNLDNNGSMPFGFFYVGSGPPTWGPPPGGNNEFISWASELNQYFGNPTGYAPAFRCPDAQQQAGPHAISYVMNFIVGVSPYYEVAVGTPPRAQTKPPKLHLMLQQGTAIFWDTAIRPDPFFPEGYLVGSDLDNQKFWFGAQTPQWRYFSAHDPYGQFPPGIFGNNRPIRLSVSSYVYRNIDPPGGSTAPWPYQGNLRFRHNGETRCNVAFSDGSVRQLTAVVRPDLTVQSHDALRRYFMIHWPPGVLPDPNSPHVGGPGGGGGASPVVKKPRRSDSATTDSGSSAGGRD